MTTGEVACECKVVLGDDTKDLALGSGDDTTERGVGSGDDMNDLGLSSGSSSFLVELISEVWAVEAVRVCDFLEGHGRGMVMVKLFFCESPRQVSSSTLFSIDTFCSVDVLSVDTSGLQHSLASETGR